MRMKDKFMEIFKYTSTCIQMVVDMQLHRTSYLNIIDHATIYNEFAENWLPRIHEASMFKLLKLIIYIFQQKG